MLLSLSAAEACRGRRSVSEVQSSCVAFPADFWNCVFFFFFSRMGPSMACALPFEPANSGYIESQRGSAPPDIHSSGPAWIELGDACRGQARNIRLLW